MPDTVKRIAGWRISIFTALIVMGICLGCLQLIVGYGNAYQSCQRTADTRANSNLRVEHAAGFWTHIVAGSRARAGQGFKRLSERAARLDGPLAHLLARSAWEQAETNRIAAEGFRVYAAQLLKDRAAVPDCSHFPPPAS